ncbi:MAG: hypothetical protein ACSHW0_07770 [Thalassotalea sp.]
MVQVTKNRRKAPDKWVYLSRVLAVLSWILFIIALVVSFYAAPEEKYGLMLYKDITTRDTWLKPLTNYLYLILWFSAFASFSCLLVTKYRSRRNTDSKQFNMVMMLITITAWVVYLLTHAS